MTEVMVARIDGRYQAYKTADGFHRTNVGPRFDDPASALAYARRLDAVPQVSPLPASRTTADLTLADGEPRSESVRPSSEAPRDASGGAPSAPPSR